MRSFVEYRLGHKTEGGRPPPSTSTRDFKVEAALRLITAERLIVKLLSIAERGELYMVAREELIVSALLVAKQRRKVVPGAHACLEALAARSCIAPEGCAPFRKVAETLLRVRRSF
jgi:hypothetical protein